MDDDDDDSVAGFVGTVEVNPGSRVDEVLGRLTNLVVDLGPVGGVTFRGPVGKADFSGPVGIAVFSGPVGNADFSGPVGGGWLNRGTSGSTEDLNGSSLRAVVVVVVVVPVFNLSGSVGKPSVDTAVALGEVGAVTEGVVRVGG